ncbi:hypothetical protein NQ314_016540 [Rhamnusium bicolor]|uniref:DDE Tnp4 domain-containing protein n=1 Tax=Rhamnusium bicolor TaxID=1586634 RepID=A0AAV8WVJ8_9CUCU|nr:hypothetical protein NQ314_016540 [Rhamnusium bicolor]
MMNDEAEAFVFNELLVSSDSSSDDDEDGLLEVRGPVIGLRRIDNYIENVVDRYSDKEFRENFRMYRATFHHIVRLIHADISSNITDTGRHTISSKSQLLIALWYFGSPDSFRSVCGRFNIGKATAVRTVRRVAEALFKISPNIITWPSGEYMETVKDGFRQMGFPNTIGAIDGCYIQIPKSKVDGISYICRKNFPCVTLQMMCDHTLKCIHCYAGEAGSNHDALVLKRSEVWSFINDRAQEKFSNDSHLIGDKAYPCLPELIPPYKDNGHLTNHQKNFNFLLSRARSTIERAFNLLQKRFRRLKNLLDVRCVRVQNNNGH